ncbi:MAG: methyltransferase domain-containing protein [Chloroflexota bacterium]|nr:MAG: methyltransferase domain-containing protein [Chloroflexota bacterium]
MSLFWSMIGRLRIAAIRSAHNIAAPNLGSLGYPIPEDDRVLEPFIRRCSALAKPRVLELGTKRSIAERSTLHSDWVPHAAEYLGTDIEPGVDVDIVADVHRLSSVVGVEQFDVVVSCSSFEHFKYPHRAAHEVMKVLKVGGLLFIQTHQTFPLHAYPYDYFRFSREALAGLFGDSMGFRVIDTDYEFPASIYASENPLTANEPAFLNVRLFGEKLAGTPDDYLYDWDV